MASDPLAREQRHLPPLEAIVGKGDRSSRKLGLIHERQRLGILSSLAVNDGLSFRELKALLDLTDGNLSLHARKLEDAGLVRSRKSFVARRPRTTYRITPAGKKTLERYLEHMEALIREIRRG